MAVEITNEGESLGIRTNGVFKYLPKPYKVEQVGSTLKITDFQTAHIINYADVTIPVTANLAALAAVVEGYMAEAGGALPTDAARESKQDAANVLTGAVTETAPATDTASSGLNGRLQRIAQRLTTIISGLTSIPVDGNKTTYSATATSLVLVTGATDFFTITGSATKTIKVTRVYVSGTRSSSNSHNIRLLKRSTANTGGTSTAPAVVPHDSTNAAGTAVVRAYTANPTLGTLVGIMKVMKAFINAAATGASDKFCYEAVRPSQAITLRGTSEVLSLSLGAEAISSADFNCEVEWTEE